MELIDRVAYRLKLRDLRLLDTVVRQGSMAKAANAAPPIATGGFQGRSPRWSNVLGVRLIDRGRQGIEPTPHGRALLKSAVSQSSTSSGTASMEIEFLSDPTAGEVRIATSEPYAAGLVTEY